MVTLDAETLIAVIVETVAANVFFETENNGGVIRLKPYVLLWLSKLALTVGWCTINSFQSHSFLRRTRCMYKQV